MHPLALFFDLSLGVCPAYFEEGASAGAGFCLADLLVPPTHDAGVPVHYTVEGVAKKEEVREVAPASCLQC